MCVCVCVCIFPFRFVGHVSIFGFLRPIWLKCSFELFLLLYQFSICCNHLFSYLKDFSLNLALYFLVPSKINNFLFFSLFSLGERGKKVGISIIRDFQGDDSIVILTLIMIARIESSLVCSSLSI